MAEQGSLQHSTVLSLGGKVVSTFTHVAENVCLQILSVV
jgi:hypothetical protein